MYTCTIVYFSKLPYRINYCKFLILHGYLIPQFNCFASNCKNTKLLTPNFYHSFIIFIVYICPKNKNNECEKYVSRDLTQILIPCL